MAQPVADSVIEILVKLQEVIWTGCMHEREGIVSVCFCLHSCFHSCKMEPPAIWLTVSFCLWIPEYWPKAYRFWQCKRNQVSSQSPTHSNTDHLSSGFPWKPTDRLSKTLCSAKRLSGLNRAKNLHASKPPGGRNSEAQALTRTLIHLLALHRKLIKCDEMRDFLLLTFQVTLSSCGCCHWPGRCIVWTDGLFWGFY